MVGFLLLTVGRRVPIAAARGKRTCQDDEQACGIGLVAWQKSFYLQCVMIGSPTPERPRRSARREQTRQRLLDAVITRIAEGGLKAVTHREVARQAGLSPTITSHYFSSRAAMIDAAFARFRERGNRERETTWSACMALVDRLDAGADRAAITEELAILAARYVCSGGDERSERLAFEMAILFEPRLDPDMVKAVREHLAAIRAPAVTFCQRFGAREPENDASILVGAMLRLQHERLNVAHQIDEASVRATMFRLLTMIVL